MTTSASVFTVVVQASSMLLAGCPTALFKSQSDGFTVVATTGDVAPGVSLDDVTVKVPIVVDRHLWGVLGSLPSDDVTPADAYAQLVPMASMAAAAIGAAEEQAALRRVVDLKGSGVDGFELFAAVVAEAAALVRSSVTLFRFVPTTRSRSSRPQHPRLPKHRERCWATQARSRPDAVRV